MTAQPRLDMDVVITKFMACCGVIVFVCLVDG